MTVAERVFTQLKTQNRALAALDAAARASAQVALEQALIQPKAYLPPVFGNNPGKSAAQVLARPDVAALVTRSVEAVVAHLQSQAATAYTAAATLGRAAAVKQLAALGLPLAGLPEHTPSAYLDTVQTRLAGAGAAFQAELRQRVSRAVAAVSAPVSAQADPVHGVVNVSAALARARGEAAVAATDEALRGFALRAQLGVSAATQRGYTEANAAAYGVAGEQHDVSIGKMWVANYADGHLPCPVCAALSGQVVPWESVFVVPDGLGFTPFGELHGPQAHPSCFPGTTLVSASGIRAATARVYDGELVVFRVRSGKQLSLTPNHPVLTPRGWVAAEFLTEGDQVLNSLCSQRVILTDEHDDDVPASIEQVAESFLRASSVAPIEVPVAAEDFHGDGLGSEVARVGTYRELPGDLEVQFCELHKDAVLQWTGADAALLPGAGDPASVLEGLRAPQYSSVGSSSVGLAVLGTQPRRSEIHGLGGGTPPDASLSEAAGDDGSGDSQALRNALLSLSGQVALGNVSSVDLFSSQGVDFVSAASTYPSFLKPPANGSGVDGQALCDVLLSLPGQVTLDDVIHVERLAFHGNVYNLETESGWYLAEGIVTHNCQCRLAPVLLAPTDEPLSAEQVPDEPEPVVFPVPAATPPAPHRLPALVTPQPVDTDLQQAAVVAPERAAQTAMVASADIRAMAAPAFVKLLLALFAVLVVILRRRRNG